MAQAARQPDRVKASIEPRRGRRVSRVMRLVCRRAGRAARMVVAKAVAGGRARGGGGGALVDRCGQCDTEEGALLAGIEGSGR
jgi:hypothetical protein